VNQTRQQAFEAVLALAIKADGASLDYLTNLRSFLIEFLETVDRKITEANTPKGTT